MNKTNSVNRFVRVKVLGIPVWLLLTFFVVIASGFANGPLNQMESVLGMQGSIPDSSCENLRFTYGKIECQPYLHTAETEWFDVEEEKFITPLDFTSADVNDWEVKMDCSDLRGRFFIGKSHLHYSICNYNRDTKTVDETQCDDKYIYCFINPYRSEVLTSDQAIKMWKSALAIGTPKYKVVYQPYALRVEEPLRPASWLTTAGCKVPSSYYKLGIVDSNDPEFIGANRVSYVTPNSFMPFKSMAVNVPDFSFLTYNGQKVACQYMNGIPVLTKVLKTVFGDGSCYIYPSEQTIYAPNIQCCPNLAFAGGKTCSPDFKWVETSELECNPPITNCPLSVPSASVSEARTIAWQECNLDTNKCVDKTKIVECTKHSDCKEGELCSVGTWECVLSGFERNKTKSEIQKVEAGERDSSLIDDVANHINDFINKLKNLFPKLGDLGIYILGILLALLVVGIVYFILSKGRPVTAGGGGGGGGGRPIIIVAGMYGGGGY
jgi:hypothetical protein